MLFMGVDLPQFKQHERNQNILKNRLGLDSDSDQFSIDKEDVTSPSDLVAQSHLLTGE